MPMLALTTILREPLRHEPNLDLREKRFLDALGLPVLPHLEPAYPEHVALRLEEDLVQICDGVAAAGS